MAFSGTGKLFKGSFTARTQTKWSVPDEMLEVVPVDEGAIFEHLHAGLEGAVELGPPDLVVVEGDGGVLGVARHVDNLALVQQPGRQQPEREVGLDDSPALGLEVGIIVTITKCITALLRVFAVTPLLFQPIFKRFHIHMFQINLDR